MSAHEIRQPGLEPGDKVTLTIDATVTKLVGDVLSYSYPMGDGFAAHANVCLGSGAVEVDHVAPAHWPPRLDDLWRDCETALWFAVSGPADGEVLLTTNCADTLDTPDAVLNQFGPLTLAFRDRPDVSAAAPPLSDAGKARADLAAESLAALRVKLANDHTGPAATS